MGLLERKLLLQAQISGNVFSNDFPNILSKRVLFGKKKFCWNVFVAEEFV